MAAGDSTKRGSVAVGEAVGTGSAITINCGFKPISVKIFNRTNKSNGQWTASMPDASAQIIVDSGVGTTDISFITTNGITPTFNGFTIGTSTAFNNVSDVVYWEARKS